jgi:hypothetical protein
MVNEFKLDTTEVFSNSQYEDKLFEEPNFEKFELLPNMNKPSQVEIP